jgi:hypothetical protein
MLLFRRGIAPVCSICAHTAALSSHEAVRAGRLRAALGLDSRRMAPPRPSAAPWCVVAPPAHLSPNPARVAPTATAGRFPARPLDSTLRMTLHLTLCITLRRASRSPGGTFPASSLEFWWS